MTELVTCAFFLPVRMDEVRRESEQTNFPFKEVVRFTRSSDGQDLRVTHWVVSASRVFASDEPTNAPLLPVAHFDGMRCCVVDRVTGERRSFSDDVRTWPDRIVDMLRAE